MMRCIYIAFYFTALVEGLWFPKAHSQGEAKPHVIPLRRESVPVQRQGKVVSFKTSYSGIVSIGYPNPQEFRVVFDTGSGHLIVPASGCKSEACLVHKSYNMSASPSAVAINEDGAAVPEGDLCDQVEIGFGTGEITGEFVRDIVCLGDSTEPRTELSNASLVPSRSGKQPKGVIGSGCLEMHVVVAVEMSTHPFKTFQFDGILGLGLASLAMSDDFSFFHLLAKSAEVPASHFGVFLTEGEDGEESEIALGGYSSQRLLEPLSWSPVAKADLGYWQVRILAVRVDGEELEACKDGTCRGVVDTGTSHLGVPKPFDEGLATLLSRNAGDLLDCRLVEAPVVEIQLEAINITLGASNYMRRLPLREGVSVGSLSTGNATNTTNATNTSTTSDKGDNSSNASLALIDENATDVTRHCRARLMSVNLPEPVGPKLWILGEPVLHKYYTVYDWGNLRVGFGLAKNRRNTEPLPRGDDGRGMLPSDVERLLMQQRLSHDRRSIAVEANGEHTALLQHQITMEDLDELAFFQVSISVKATCRM